MAIKLNIPDPKTRGDLRAEYVKKHHATTAKLEKVLRKLIDRNRIDYQQYISRQLISRVEIFIKMRKPEDSVESYALDLCKNSGNWRMLYEDLFPLVKALTNYEKSAATAYRLGSRVPFEVKLESSDEQVSFELAEAQVESTVQTFLYRAKDKLLDLMLAYPQYDANLIRGNFFNGAFEGTISLTFDRPDLDAVKDHFRSSFVIDIGLKYNRSKYGTPFVQYPLTFSDYYKFPIGSSNEISGRENISGTTLENFFNFDAWVPPKQKTTKFRVIKVGSVIRTADGTIRLVTRTKKDKHTKKDVAVTFGVKNAD